MADTPEQIAAAKAEAQAKAREERLARAKQLEEYKSNIGKKFVNEDDGEVTVQGFVEAHLCRGETQHKPSFIVNGGNQNHSWFVPCEPFLNTHKEKGIQ